MKYCLLDKLLRKKDVIFGPYQETRPFTTPHTRVWSKLLAQSGGPFGNILYGGNTV